MKILNWEAILWDLNGSQPTPSLVNNRPTQNITGYIEDVLAHIKRLEIENAQLIWNNRILQKVLSWNSNGAYIQRVLLKQSDKYWKWNVMFEMRIDDIQQNPWGGLNIIISSNNI